MSLPAPPSYPGNLKPVCGYPRRVSPFRGEEEREWFELHRINSYLSRLDAARMRSTVYEMEDFGQRVGDTAVEPVYERPQVTWAGDLAGLTQAQAIGTSIDG